MKSIPPLEKVEIIGKVSRNTVVVQIVAGVRPDLHVGSAFRRADACVHVPGITAGIVPVHGQVAHVIRRSVPVVCRDARDADDLTRARAVLVAAEDK